MFGVHCNNWERYRSKIYKRTPNYNNLGTSLSTLSGQNANILFVLINVHLNWKLIEMSEIFNWNCTRENLQHANKSPGYTVFLIGRIEGEM